MSGARLTPGRRPRNLPVAQDGLKIGPLAYLSTSAGSEGGEWRRAWLASARLAGPAQPQRVTAFQSHLE